MLFRKLNNRQFFVLVLGAAVLLRLLLMPFFGHVDIYSEYRRVFYLLENELYFDNSYRFVTFSIEMLFAAFSQIFINVSEGLFHLPYPTKSTSSLLDYEFFLNDPNVFRHLFFFKLPYLLFDIATAWTIWRFVDNPLHKRIALVIWLFNPVTLFAIYIFGRFEVFGLFFLAATALQLKADRRLLAVFLFALALHCREINVIFAPFLLIALIDFKDHWLKNAILLLVSSAIIALVWLLPDWLMTALGGDTDRFTDPTATHDSDRFNKLLSLGYYWFYPIIIGLAALALYSWEIGSRSHAERFVVSCAVVLFIYFGFNVHSVHYASWLVIFPVLCAQYDRKIVLPFVVFSIAWIVLWLLKTDAGVFTLFLAAPLSTDFIGLGQFPEFFNQHIATQDLSLHQTIQIMRALFLVVMGFFAYRILRKPQR